MRNILLSILSALLLSAGWLGVSGLPLLVGFIPLLIVSAGYGPGRRNFWKTFGCVALALGLWSGMTTWWIGQAPGAWVGSLLSVLITVVLFGTVFMLYHYVSHRAPAPLAFTVLIAGWIAAEYLYTIGEVSFPWLVLGNGFSGDVKLIQWYSATGVFGGSFWALLSNVTLFRALMARNGRVWITPAVVVLLPIVVSLISYRAYREPEQTVTVTAVQPNFNPYNEKYYLKEELQIDIMLGLAAHAPADVDYIIFPETAVDGILENGMADDRTIGRYRGLLEERYPGAEIILGAMTQRLYMPGERVPATARTRNGYTYDVYNTALSIDTTSRVQVHHKAKLVIGVEKMPYAGRFAWLDKLILDMGGTTGNLGQDSVLAVMRSPNTGIVSGSPICWEGVYGEHFSRFVRQGAQVMFIISNDGWWEDTPGYKRLFSFSRLRAIETRRAIGRSANTGISGMINQRGDVLASTGWDERVAVTGRIALNDKQTFYTRYGDYVARISVLLFGLGVLGFIAYRVRRRDLTE